MHGMTAPSQRSMGPTRVFNTRTMRHHVFTTVVLLLVVVASFITSSMGHAAASSSSPLEIHRRRECSMERLWETAFAHANTTTDSLFDMQHSEDDAVAVWTRRDSCSARNASVSTGAGCFSASNVAIADGALTLNASAAASSSASVSVALPQPLAEADTTANTAHRLRLHALFPASGSACNATAMISLSSNVSASLTLVSHANGTRVLLLDVQSPSRNVTVELTPPCPLDPAATKSHVVDIEWEAAGASVQWIRWQWDGHALYEVGVALLVAAPTAPINVSLSLFSSTKATEAVAFRVKKLEIQRVTSGQDASVCRPRVIHAAANCRPHHQRFEPRLGDDQGYLSLSQVDDFVRAVPSRFPPQLTKIEEIGLSTENRSLVVLCIGACADTNTNASDVMPQVLFTGMHHSREPISMMNLVYTIDLLALDFANGDVDMTALLLSRQLWFVLVVNPDGYARNEALETWANRRAGQRKNARTQGGCTTSKADVGVDLNRNYDVCFSEDDVGSSTDPCGEDYRGPAPFSEPETLAIKRFVERAGSHFTVSLNYHSFGRYFNVPFACKAMDTPQGKDLQVYQDWAKEMTRFNGFRYGQPWKDDNLYSVNGETSDWLWAKHGIFAMSPEVGPAFSTPIDEGFWPAKEDVPALSVELHYSNLVAARLSGPIYEVIVTNVTREPAADEDEGLSALLHVKLELQNHGLRTARDVEIVLTTALEDGGVTDKFTTTASVKADALGTIRSNSSKPLTASRSLAIPEASVLHLLIRDALSCQYIRLTTFATSSDATSMAYQQWQPVELPLCGVCRSLGRDEDELKALGPAPQSCQSVEDLVQPDALGVAVLTEKSEVRDQTDDEADAGDEERDAKSEAPATSTAPTLVTTVAPSTAAPTTIPPETPAPTTTTPKPSPTTTSPPPGTAAAIPSPTLTAPPPAPTTAEPVDEQLSAAKTSSSASSFASITSFVSVPILASVFFVLLLVVLVVMRRRRRQSREPVSTNASGFSKNKGGSKRKNYVKVMNDDDDADEDDEGHHTARSPRSRGLRGGSSDDDDAEYGRRRSPMSPSTTTSKRNAANDDDELV